MFNKIDKKKPILIATHNPGKAKEFKKLFSKLKIKTMFSAGLGIEEPEETGNSFKENSILKAKSGISSGLNVIADDSGLCVKSLDGKPGIYSARWAKKYGGWEGAMKKIYEELLKTNKKDFSAKYICCLTIAWQNGDLISYNGEIKGKISWPPIGKKGFGYDPIFIPNNHIITFGQMNKKDKMLVDHRYDAFKKIIKNHINETGQE